MSSNKETVRKKSFIFDHAKAEHGGTIPPMNVKIVAQCLGDPGLRKAMEAVLIRDKKPPLNGKEEWTNNPRKSKPKETENVTSNNNSSNAEA